MTNRSDPNGNSAIDSIFSNYDGENSFDDFASNGTDADPDFADSCSEPSESSS